MAAQQFWNVVRRARVWGGHHNTTYYDDNDDDDVDDSMPSRRAYTNQYKLGWKKK